MPHAKKDDLLAEKSLSSIYKLTWKLQFPCGSTITSISLFLVLEFNYLLSNIPHKELAGLTRSVFDIGISFSSSILGFMIAGFTIFSSLTNPDLFVKIANIQDKATGLSWLKKAFLPFMHAFFHYAAFLILLVLLKSLSYPYGPIASVINYFTEKPDTIKHAILSTSLSLCSAWLFYLTLLLASFIFNVYHSIMLTITVRSDKLIDTPNK